MGKYVDSFGGCKEEMVESRINKEGELSPRATRCKLVNSHFLTHAVPPSCGERTW